MPDALLYTNKLTLESPKWSIDPRVERIESGSYSHRFTIGINPQIEKITLTWVGLTASQARSLDNQLKGAFVDVIAYAAPPRTSDQYWTCLNHNIATIYDDGNKQTFAIDATLRREYDAT